MQLIVITPDGQINDEARIVNSLFANGLQRLHVRKPSFGAGDLRKYLERLDSQWYDRVVVNSSFELYNEFKIGGIHLSSFTREDSNTWSQIADIPPSAISTSYHGWREIEDNDFSYGYVFISPVFDSISKTGYHAAINLAGAIETKQKLAKENEYCPSIIGLGGISTNQIEAMHRYGFDGIAMLGAIWQSENPVKTFVELERVVSSLQSD